MWLESTILFENLTFFYNQWYSNLIFFIELIVFSLKDIIDKSWEKWLLFDNDFNFDQAQTNTLLSLSLVIVLNALCIFLIWKVHGHRIYKRFKKPAPPRVFEELSRSLANLKLPKVHSPRM